MRQIYRITTSEAWWIVAETPEAALKIWEADLKSNDLDDEELADEMADADIATVPRDKTIGYLLDSGKRVTLTAEEWLELLPDGEFVFASTLFQGEGKG